MRRALTLTLLALALPASAPAATPLAPGETQVYIGQTSIRYAEEFAEQTGRQAAGGMWYLAAYADPAARLAEMADAVRKYPGLRVDLGLSLGSISSPEPPRTALVAAGVYDEQLRALAAGIKALPAEVQLRIGYEFDLLGGQYGPAETYKLAYRHIVDLFRAEGVTNVLYVWHSAGAFWRGVDQSFLGQAEGEYGFPAPDYDLQPIAAFYPGDGYVDAFGISYWGDTCCFGGTDDAARGLYEERTRQILDQARAMKLPIVIAESTPANVGADSGRKSVAWLDGAFALIEQYDIRAWNLISMNWQDSDFFSQPFWGGYWPDARIGFYPDTRARFLSRTGPGSRYVFRPGA